MPHIGKQRYILGESMAILDPNYLGISPAHGIFVIDLISI
jgi:hypothetical protein